MALKTAESRPYNAGVFLETSAQILRLLSGSADMRHGIQEIAQTSSKVGTSSFVFAEFKAVIGNLYSLLAEGMRALPQPSQPRSFTELWKSVAEAIPVFIRGGPKLLSIIVAEFGDELAQKYERRQVTPVEVASFLDGQKNILLQSFFFFGGRDMKAEGLYFDNSSCCVWGPPASEKCSIEPAAHCQLQTLCVQNNRTFFTSLRALSLSNREESKWISKNLGALSRLNGVELMQKIGRHPGPLGDVIIFWETPDHWTLLTRDRTFRILQERMKRKMQVLIIRPRRSTSGQMCMVKFEVKGKPIRSVSARLTNYSSLGAAVMTTSRVVRPGDKVTISAKEWNGTRTGTVVRVARWRRNVIHGIRFSFSPATSNSVH
jgi:hypothetical protein